MALDEEWGEPSGLVGKVAAGRYLIVSELATDNRRTLYEAENVELGIRVSLGVVRGDGKPTEQRLRNGQKLRALRQPGLVSVLDVGKLDSGELYVATERAEGTTLRALIAKEHLDQRRALLIVRQVLEALAAAHAVGELHGDVRPENIIITPGLGDDRVKLSDFGVATLTGPTRAGDPVYSAPESALGSIDARADIYAAGAVLFELLTGHPPFFADDANALRRLHAYAPMQTLKQRAPELSFSDSLETIVETALAKKRDARYQSAGDMIAALDPAIQAIEEAAAAPQPPAGGRRRKPNDSLLLLAQDLMPQAQASGQAANELLVPVNVDRQVPVLPWSTRARLFMRRMVDRLRSLDRRLGISAAIRRQLAKLSRRQKQIAAAVAGALVLALLAIVTCSGGGRTKPAQSDLQQRAKALVDQGHGGEAVVLIEKDIAAHPDNAGAYVALGDTQLALSHDDQALTAYEKAIGLTPAVATQPDVIAKLSHVASSTDPATALGALELIASRSGAAGGAALASHASTNPDPQVRHRAALLAERSGAAAQIDRVASWLLDLEQATSCEDRRSLADKLAATKDPRTASPVQQAKRECAQHDPDPAPKRTSGRAKHR